MKRQPTTQQITWFLDLERNEQLDLNPPYQRKSVWSSKDKKFFLDTIFKNYPAPPIFIHRTIDDNGFTEYHVVDGKQRLETIIGFANNQIAMAVNFGDVNLNGKKFKNLSTEYKRKFWDYTMVVDFIDNIDGNNIEEVFDRVNRNARNLQQQELRHARYDGWFINVVELESQKEFWWDFKITTKARDKRMRNVQFISELFMIILQNRMVGFDQSLIDEVYAAYDDLDEKIEDEGFEPDAILDRVENIKGLIRNLDHHNGCIMDFVAGSNNNFYTLWAFLYIHPDIDISAFGDKYKAFMEGISNINDSNFVREDLPRNQVQYYENSRGASTDSYQRVERLKALESILDV